VKFGMEIRNRITPRERATPQISGEDLTEDAAESIIESIDAIERVESGYRVSKTVPESRQPVIGQRLVQFDADVSRVVSADVLSEVTELYAVVADPVTAIGILDALLTATGECRVCGDVNCSERVVFTDTGVMHRPSGVGRDACKSGSSGSSLSTRGRE